MLYRGIHVPGEETAEEQRNLLGQTARDESAVNTVPKNDDDVCNYSVEFLEFRECGQEFPWELTIEMILERCGVRDLCHNCVHVSLDLFICVIQKWIDILPSAHPLFEQHCSSNGPLSRIARQVSKLVLMRKSTVAMCNYTLES
jgi:hypothetical protein